MLNPKSLASPGPSLHIYVMCWNEEHILPWTLRYYRYSHPNASLTLLDNMSTDSSVAIAKSFGCEIQSFDTGGQYDEQTQVRLRNRCWRRATADWVLIVDADEFAEFTPDHLAKYSCDGITSVTFEGYNMVTHRVDLCETDLSRVTHGCRSRWYDKTLLFRPSHIRSMRFSTGSHECSPRSRLFRRLRQSIGRHRLFHFKYVNIEQLSARYELVNVRSSAANKAQGLGYHYHQDRQTLVDEFNEVLLNSSDLGSVLPLDMAF